jgi:hypothetical protein
VAPWHAARARIAGIARPVRAARISLDMGVPPH